LSKIVHSLHRNNQAPALSVEIRVFPSISKKIRRAASPLFAIRFPPFLSSFLSI